MKSWRSHPLSKSRSKSPYPADAWRRGDCFQPPSKDESAPITLNEAAPIALDKTAPINLEEEEPAANNVEDAPPA